MGSLQACQNCDPNESVDYDDLTNHIIETDKRKTYPHKRSSSHHSFIATINDVFIFDRVLAEGGSGKVVLVEHKNSKNQYVAKQIKQTQKRTLSFKHESFILSKLNHPNIVSMHSSYTELNTFHYIILSYCKGGTLCQRVKTIF